MIQAEPVLDDGRFEEEEVAAAIAEINEKFIAIQQEIMLAKFSTENKPDKEMVGKILEFMEILSDPASKPEFQDNYLELAKKYLFLAKIIRDFTDEKDYSIFPV